MWELFPIRLAPILLAPILFGIALLFAWVPARGASLVISCGAVGKELELCRSGAQGWAEATGNQVEVVSTPSATNERLALYQQLLAAGSGDIDVLQIDVIWPGMLARHLVDLEPYAAGQIDRHFPASIASNRVDGRLVALPWFASAGLLYYRKDLLERHGDSVPATWEELSAIALRIQEAERAAGRAGFWGFVWQGRAYEGLTCDALEWIASHGGGTIVDGDGKITIDNPRAALAMKRAASWVGAITPRGVLNYAEEDARGIFQSGNALFMRNWPYAWALAQAEESPVRGRVGVARLPAGEGGKPAATLGGWQLAVSKYSANQDLAADLVLHLTSAAEQKRRALAAAFLPTRPNLYRDPELLAANPFLAEMTDVLDSAVARPAAVTGQQYNRVSNRVWNRVHGVISGKMSASAAVTQLAKDLGRIRRRGGW
jgi:trehalose/maltose transport system substrate-binding protein